MTGRGYQLLHSDAHSAELEALGLDSSLFGAAGLPAPIFQALVPRRAGVFDENANTFGTVDEPATFTRASNGIYLDDDGVYKVASANAIRAEYSSAGAFLGYLFEPAITNKCENYNANPDAGLSGYAEFGDAAGVLSRIDDAAALVNMGLATVAGPLVVELDNSLGSTTYRIYINGTTGNTNEHSFSVWARRVAGSGNCILRNNAGTLTKNFTNAAYARIVLSGTPSATTNKLGIEVEAGTTCRFILNQLEELPVPSSPIITTGTSETRAIDALSWATLPAGFSQSEGILIIELGQPSAFVAIPTFKPIVTFRSSHLGGILNVVNGASFVIRTSDGSTSGQTTVAGSPLSAGQRATLVVRWGASQFQIGSYSPAGVWSWNAAGAYDGAFTSNNLLSILGALDLPFLICALRIYNRDLAQAEIERLISAL